MSAKSAERVDRQGRPHEELTGAMHEHRAIAASLRRCRVLVGLAVLVLACPALAQPLSADPVEAFRQALALKDLPRMAKTAPQIRTAGDLSRALLLAEWQRRSDIPLRDDLVVRFIAAVQEGLRSGDPIRQEGVLVLLAETAREARKVAEQTQCLRPQISALTPDVVALVDRSTGNVQLTALQTLGLIHPDAALAMPAIERSIAPRQPVDLRRMAAFTLGSIVGILAEEAAPAVSAVEMDAESVRELFVAGRLVVRVASGVLRGRDPDADVRRLSLGAIATVARRLNELGPRIYEPLPGAATDITPREAVRRRFRLEQRAAFQDMLKLFQEDTILDGVRDAIQDPNADIRRLALLTVESLANTRTEPLPTSYSTPPPPRPMPPDRPREREAERSPNPAQLLLPPVPAPVTVPSPPQTEGPSFQPIVALMRPVKLADEPPDDNPLRNDSLRERLAAGRGVGVLAARLTDQDVLVRRAAVDALEALGKWAKPAIPHLIGALSDPGVFVRWGVVRILGKLAAYYPSEPIGGVPELARLMCDPDTDLELETIHTLGQYGPRARDAVSALAKIVLLQSDQDLRTHAMVALIAIGDAAVPALPAIGIALLDRNPRIREAAAQTFGRFGRLAKDYAPNLRQALWDPEPAVRRAASEALGQVLAK
jgi:hypothetical protein